MSRSSNRGGGSRGVGGGAAGESLYIPATVMRPYAGTPALGTSDNSARASFMLFDPTSIEATVSDIHVPHNWRQFDTYIDTIAANVVAANEVVFSLTIEYQASGELASASETVPGFYSGIPLSISGTRYTVQRHSLGASSTFTPSIARIWQARLIRVANDAADDYAGDIGVVGILLVAR